MLQSVDLRDYMLTNPVKIREDANLLDAIEAIVENKISGVLVVDADGKLVGILSELDCLRASLSATYNEGGIGQVKEYMASTELDIAHPKEDIVDIAQDMLKKKHRRRPVIENGKLVGQITCRQLLSAVQKFYH